MEASKHLQPDRAVDIADLELYTQFIQGSAQAFGIDIRSGNNEFAQFTALALQKTYLLHSLLAVSALQLYLAQPSRRELLVRAAYLQSTALEQAKPHLTSSLHKDETIAILFFSSWTAIYSLAEGAITLTDGSEADSNLIGKLLHSFQLMRGTALLLRPHWQFLASSWAGPVFRSSVDAGSGDGTTSADLSGTWPEYRALRALTFGMENSEQRTACLQAIDELARSLDALSRSGEPRVRTRMILTWGVSIEPTFEAMLLESKPVALVILASYAVLLHRGREEWWIVNWPELLLEHIDSQLGPEWSELLAWPRSELAHKA